VNGTFSWNKIVNKLYNVGGNAGYNKAIDTNAVDAIASHPSAENIPKEAIALIDDFMAEHNAAFFVKYGACNWMGRRNEDDDDTLKV
jgi:hypothetical protein